MQFGAPFYIPLRLGGALEPIADSSYVAAQRYHFLRALPATGAILTPRVKAAVV
jgi:hypothetical protein